MLEGEQGCDEHAGWVQWDVLEREEKGGGVPSRFSSEVVYLSGCGWEKHGSLYGLRDSKGENICRFLFCKKQNKKKTEDCLNKLVRKVIFLCFIWKSEKHTYVYYAQWYTWSSYFWFWIFWWLWLSSWKAKAMCFKILKYSIGALA